MHHARQILPESHDSGFGPSESDAEDRSPGDAGVRPIGRIRPHRALRVLALAPVPFYIDRGTPIDVDLLVRALTQEGHQVDLICYPEGEERSYEGLTVHRARAHRSLHGTPPGFTVRKVLKDVAMLSKAIGLARRNHYDVVHAGEEAVFIAMLLKRVFGVPYVYDMDSSIAQQLVEQKPGLRPFARIFDRMEHAAIRGSIAAAPVCRALEHLARSRGAAHVETLHDISQLQDPDREGTGWLRSELGLRRPILMYVGNLQPYQGIDLLLESLAIATRRGSEVDLVLAGGSRGKIQEYGRKADSLGIADRTHFLGPWPNDRLGELLAEADILTAPRIRGINTPMKIFPYLHTGRPVLVTDLPTHNQLLDDSVAMLAPPDPVGFARAIQSLAEDPSLRDRLGARGRSFVEDNHTYPSHLERVRRLYGYVSGNLRADAAPAVGELQSA